MILGKNNVKTERNLPFRFFSLDNHLRYSIMNLYKLFIAFQLGMRPVGFILSLRTDFLLFTET
ncbi:hypothetical protein HMPREF9398_2236 [Streptococcus sanguinis VMC66]|nr:hypothetical protein HMPREF9398_2236 [Streptococcus sanguinis VMC66]